jgi:signal transduction histidine kinase
MHGDQMRLRQALLNLMSNANKFTERGHIRIDAHQRQENGCDWITLAIADTGIGMTAEQMGNPPTFSAKPLRLWSIFE